MKFPTREQIIELNRRQIEMFGGDFNGTDNLINPASLEWVLAAIQHPIYGEQRFKTLAEKAAALTWYIITAHVFYDGNKRTGMAAMITFIEANQNVFASSSKEMLEIALRVALYRSNNYTLAEFTTWIDNRIILTSQYYQLIRKAPPIETKPQKILIASDNPYSSFMIIARILGYWNYNNWTYLQYFDHTKRIDPAPNFWPLVLETLKDYPLPDYDMFILGLEKHKTAPKEIAGQIKQIVRQAETEKSAPIHLICWSYKGDDLTPEQKTAQTQLFDGLFLVGLDVEAQFFDDLFTKTDRTT